MSVFNAPNCLPPKLPNGSRRVVASAKRLEEIIATGQRRGLSPTAIVLHADGSTEVRYADASPVRFHKPKGWDI